MIVAVLLLSSLPLQVASADESPSIQLTITPEQNIYDLVGNVSRQENVTFSAVGINLNDEVNIYNIRVAVHEEYYGEDGTQLHSTTFESSSINLNFTHFDQEWENDTNYTILAQLQERPTDEDQFETIFNATFNFSVGEIPEPPEPEPEPVPLQNLDFDCVLGDDGVWDMMLDDYGYLTDYPSVLGMIECSLTNTNSVSILFNLSFQNPSLSDGAGFDMTGFSSFPIRISNNSTEGFNLSLDCGTPSNCEETNGSISIEVEIYSEDVTNWTSNTSQQIIEYTIEENNTTITPSLIKGCMDESAENFNPNATENDDSCIYPRPPEPPTCLLCNFTYNIPDPVSVNTPATFSANVTGTEGWIFYGNANISWGFDGTIIYGHDVVHTYTSIPSGGTTDVIVCVGFSDGVERCQTTTITVNQSLTGYIGQSSLLEPMISDNVGGIHFDATALGGLAPYSYQWQFGDGNSSTNESLVHEFADWGVYDVTLAITDARGDNISLDVQIEISDSQSYGNGTNNDDNEDSEEVGLEPFAVATTGGGTLALILLSRHNSRKKRDKILEAARLKIRDEKSVDADMWWEDDGTGVPADNPSNQNESEW
ncbi:MAG: PKD domain-containing protein [Candidatus Thalassarchaeaceae archaeon]|nr:PKD domain-containing protein [Candidatus Thalassarchaeaceae archaeon]